MGSLWIPPGLRRGESVVFPLICQHSHSVCVPGGGQRSEILFFPPPIRLPSPALVSSPPAPQSPPPSSLHFCKISKPFNITRGATFTSSGPALRVWQPNPGRECPAAPVQEFENVGQLRKAPGQHPPGTVSPVLSLNLLLFKETKFS